MCAFSIISFLLFSTQRIDFSVKNQQLGKLCVEVDSIRIFDDFFVKCELCKQQIEMLSQMYTYVSRETAEWKVDVKFNWQLYRSFFGGRATSKTLQKSFLKNCLVESATIHCQNRLYLLLWPLQINWLKWMEKVKSIRSFLDFGVTNTYWINADLKSFSVSGFVFYTPWKLESIMNVSQ